MNKFDLYVKYSLYFIFGLFGFIVIYKILNNHEVIFEWFTKSHWSFIDGIITIMTLAFVIINWVKNRKQLDKIPILFNIDDKNYLLDLDIHRKQISRGEIQGILSAFQKVTSQRYSIEYLSDINFLDDIYKIQNNQLNELKIVITNSELNGWKKDDNNFHDGFNLNKMKQL